MTTFYISVDSFSFHEATYTSINSDHQGLVIPGH